MAPIRGKFTARDVDSVNGNQLLLLNPTRGAVDMRLERGKNLRARPRGRHRGACFAGKAGSMSTALKERLTERLRTSRHWLPVEDLEAGMVLDLHGEIAEIKRRSSRVLVVTIDKKQLPYKPGEKALLAF
jgi:hypothetical protein